MDYCSHLRPGEWKFSLGGSIRDYEQYQHLSDVLHAVKQNKKLRVVFGDYIVTPDIVICRKPVTDEKVNEHGTLLGGDGVAGLTPLRHDKFKSEYLARQRFMQVDAP